MRNNGSYYSKGSYGEIWNDEDERMKKIKPSRWVKGFHCRSMCQHWTGLCLVVNVWVHAAMAKPWYSRWKSGFDTGNGRWAQLCPRLFEHSSLEYCTHILHVSYCLYWLLTDWFYCHQPPQAVQLPTPGSLTSPPITGNQLRIQLVAVRLVIPNNRIHGITLYNDWLYWVFWYMGWCLWGGEDWRTGLSRGGRIHGQEGYMDYLYWEGDATCAGCAK